MFRYALDVLVCSLEATPPHDPPDYILHVRVSRTVF